MFTLLNNFPVENLQSILSDGVELEKAFQYEKKYVFFLTENIPHEETLTILLLDDNCNEIEKIELYAAYMPGILNVTDVEPKVIAFSFWPEQPLKLCYSDNKKYRWQFKSLSHVSYSGGFFKAHNLIVTF